MIGLILYFTTGRLDIFFATSLFARYQADPTVSNLIADKQIFKYLKGSKALGLWYPSGNDFSL